MNSLNTRYSEVTSQSNRTTRRAGLSLLELIGCLICVVGGAWLGAIYLGVNVRHLAYTVLEESELLDYTPETWRPITPEEEGKPRLTQNQIAEALHSELVALREEISALRTTGGIATHSGRLNSKNELEGTNSAFSNQSTLKNTLAYWHRINEIAFSEAALQKDAESAFSEEHAAKVFALKGRVSRFAAKAVEVIPSEQVDPSVLLLGKQLAQWYTDGGLLYDRAMQIWESPARDKARTTLTQRWSQSQKQHHNEARLLNDKAAGVRDKMIRRYQVEFPEFGSQTTVEASSRSSTEQDG